MSKRLFLTLLATASLASAGHAYGQAAAASETSASADAQVAGLETVIVTARKRAEDEQTVPISISSYSQADLDRLDINTIEDLRYVSPSVYIAPTTFRQDTLNVTIRGQRDFRFQLRPVSDVLRSRRRRLYGRRLSGAPGRA